jgi:hypothetical protein
MTTPAQRLLAAVTHFIAGLTPEQLAEYRAALPTPTTKQQRIKALVQEIQGERDRQRAAELALKIRAAAEEDEPKPAPKTAAELKKQAIQDANAYYEYIAKWQKERQS